MNWLTHILGIDTQQSQWYDAWSGCIPALLTSTTIGAAAYALLRRHNCHQHRCWRIGRHPVASGQYVVCRRHHPDPKIRDGLSARHIAVAHDRHAARQPGA